MERNSFDRNNDDPLLEKYFKSITALPLLDRETEHQLALRMVKGDAEARKKLIESNLRFVIKVANEYASYGARIKLIDLIQEGNIGLMEAIKKFDPHRGTRFMTYASHWIRAFILKYILKNKHLVSTGSSTSNSRIFFNLQKEREKLAREGFSPNDTAALAQRLDVGEDRLKKFINASRPEMSFDGGVRDSKSENILSGLSEILADEKDNAEAQVSRQQTIDRVQQVLEILRANLAKTNGGLRLLKILNERLFPVSGQPKKTLRELGDEFSVGRERVRQLEERVKERFIKIYRGLSKPKIPQM